MNTKNLAIATAVGVLSLAGLLLAFPAMAASVGVPSASPSIPQATHQLLPRAQLQAGQSFVFSSVAGGYREVGTPTANGSATGSLDVTITGSFAGGYTASVTGGQITFNGTTYTISSGSGELGTHGVRMVGQAQAGDSAQLLFSGRNLGKFGTTAYGVLNIDLTSGTSEYGIRLLVTLSSA